MLEFERDDQDSDGQDSDTANGGRGSGGRSATSAPLEPMPDQPEPNGRRQAADSGAGGLTEEASLTGGGMGEEGGDPSSHADSTNAAQEQQRAGAPSTAPTLSVPEVFEPWRHDLTELGDARRLKDAFEPNVRWVKQKKAWIIYHEGRWHGDETGLVLQQGARQMVDAMRHQVRTEECQARTRAEERRKCTEELKSRSANRHAHNSQADHAELMRQFSKLLSGIGDTTDDGSVPGSGRKAWIKKGQSRQGLQNMVTLLQAEPGISVEATELDKDPDLLGVANGVVDLRTGHLRAAGRDDLITRTTATLYDPGGAAPQWEQFLKAVQPDPKIRAFLGRAVGYSLTGHTREQRFFVLHGDGSTGKTTLIEAIQFVLGDYAVGLPASSLVAKTQHGIPNDLARLAGVRFVPAAETNEFQRMDEALIKRLSGSDTIVARFLNKDFFSFQPTHKPWIATNHLPHVQDTGNGFWRRPVLIPFDQKFTGDTDDKRLGDKLKAEAPGILAWAVRQCLEWQRQGLNTPPCLVQSVNEYRTGQDVVARFIADCCDVGDGFSVPADQLYQAFQRWASVQGERDLTGTAFGTRLTGLGYGTRRTSRGSLRCGLALM